MIERCTLRMRSTGHLDPRRQAEAVVEVLRGGEVVATIYGCREGLHVVSPVFSKDGKNAKTFFLHVDPPDMAGLVVPLLRPGERCSWCDGTRTFEEGPCPACQ